MKCKTKFCRNESAPTRKYCYTCISRSRRKNNPIRASYQALKDNAKRRGKAFLLTFEEFKQFAIETKYYKKKGIYKKNYHIDRIDENGPYSVDNIQVLTNTENVKKFLKYRYDEHVRRMNFELLILKPVAASQEADAVPF